jgi:thiosulfate/3-mercaptopyruvate sulfurtransferase
MKRSNTQGREMTLHRNLISAKDLESCLDGPDIRIVDCRFDLVDPLAGRRAYEQAHIRGAVFADLDRDLAAPISSGTGRHPLPDVVQLSETLGRLGIGNNTDVIVYDAGPGALAARAWWLLRWVGHERVRLLDGGLQQWVADARPIRAGEEHAAPSTFLPRPNNEMIVTTAELARDVEGIKALNLIDARDAARFRGELEPIDPVAGHIPGSVNLPYTLSLNEDGLWRSREELASLWTGVLGGDARTPWIAMCGSGVTACHLAISAMEAGFREPRLYVGSWSEWIRNPERPIGLGDALNRASQGADLA